MAKFNKKIFVGMSASDISKMKAPELRELLRGARNAFMAQEKMFDKYEDSVYSHAKELMLDFYDERGKKAPSRMNISEMRREVFRLQEFFTSESSTVPGARRIAFEQDKRIFGVNEKTGKPNYRMPLEVRRNMWSAYNEFKLLKKESYIRNMGSDTIQTILGQMFVQGTKENDNVPYWFVSEDFQELERRLEKVKEYEEWEMSNYDRDNELLSGKRPY